MSFYGMVVYKVYIVVIFDILGCIFLDNWVIMLMLGQTVYIGDVFYAEHRYES